MNLRNRVAQLLEQDLRTDRPGRKQASYLRVQRTLRDGARETCPHCGEHL